MKAFFCIQCNTFTALQKENVVRCYCGKSKGRYLENLLDAEMTGPLIPLGVSSKMISGLVYDEAFQKICEYYLNRYPIIKDVFPIVWRKNFEGQELGTGVIIPMKEDVLNGS